MLNENVYATPLGPIHYWVEKAAGAPVTLVVFQGYRAAAPGQVSGDREERA